LTKLKLKNNLALIFSVVFLVGCAGMDTVSQYSSIKAEKVDVDTSDASLQEDPKRISPEDPRARGFFNFDRRSPDRGFFDLMVHDSPIG